MDHRDASTVGHEKTHPVNQIEPVDDDDSRPFDGSGSSCMPEALSEVQQQKVTQIRRACSARDVPVLASLAAGREGFVDDVVRREACMSFDFNSAPCLCDLETCSSFLLLLDRG